MSAASLGQLVPLWNRFFFEPRDPSLCGIIRIAYSLLLLINVLVWMPDLEMWFSETGALPYASSRALIDPDALTLFRWLPRTTSTLWACYGLFLAHIIMLLIGLFSRFQAACVFIWLVSFQHRNIILFDGEDTLFRLFCFYLILTPCGYAHSLDADWRKRKGPPPIPWGLRLFQIQMCLLYLATALFKMKGEDWENGTALYYVARLDDLFGGHPLPDALFESMPLIHAMTWGVVFLELLLPFALWFRETRRYALVIAILFHVATDYAMNLFLFHWLMLVGLLSFVTDEDRKVISSWIQQLRERVRPTQ